MTMNQDEAIARTCGCGEFDEPLADEYWEDLTVAERWEIGKRQAREDCVSDCFDMETGDHSILCQHSKEADYVPF